MSRDPSEHIFVLFIYFITIIINVENIVLLIIFVETVIHFYSYISEYFKCYILHSKVPQTEKECGTKTSGESSS